MSCREGRGGLKAATGCQCCDGQDWYHCDIVRVSSFAHCIPLPSPALHLTTLPVWRHPACPQQACQPVSWTQPQNEALKLPGCSEKPGWRHAQHVSLQSLVLCLLERHTAGMLLLQHLNALLCSTFIIMMQFTPTAAVVRPCAMQNPPPVERCCASSQHDISFSNNHCMATLLHHYCSTSTSQISLDTAHR